jgi:subtilisin-like proprotein convertase family protein
VYDDLNNDGVFEQSGQATASSTNVSLAIPSRTTTSSTNTISGMNGTIADLNVNLTINDPNDSNLALTLVAPSGTQIALANGNGSGGANFTNTTFDDQATTPISAGSPPFTGSFEPIGALSAVNGISPNGLWTLRIANNSRHNSGTLVSWSLAIATTGEPSSVTDADGNYQLTNLAPGVHHLREIVQSGLSATTPASGSQDVSVGIGATVSGVNFGNAAPAPPPPPKGDFDRDGQLTVGDVGALMVALQDLDTYEMANNLDATQLVSFGDLDGDGAVTNLEAQALIVLLANTAAPSSAPSGGSPANSQAVVTSTVAVADQSVLGPTSDANSKDVIPATAVADLSPQLPARLLTTNVVSQSAQVQELTPRNRTALVEAAPVAAALKAEAVDHVLREETLLRRRLTTAAGPAESELLNVFLLPSRSS